MITCTVAELLMLARMVLASTVVRKTHFSLINIIDVGVSVYSHQLSILRACEERHEGDAWLLLLTNGTVEPAET